MQLTIAIPTYNRNAILEENLARLLPQLTPECFLLILDNHSPVPVSDTVSDLMSQYPEVRFKIVRHRANLGGDVNVLRCFELCETPWIWVLSDDDPPLPDAITTIFRTIQRWPEAVFINFSTDLYKRASTISGQGREEFLDKLDNFSLIQFISAGIYRVDALLPYFAYGTQFSYGNAPQVLLVMAALEEKNEFVLLPEVLVNFGPAVGTTYSVIRFCLQMPINMDLPISARLRDRWQAAVLSGMSWVGFRELWRLLVVMVERGKVESRTAQFIIEQVFGRAIRYHGRWQTRLEARLLTFLIRFPRISMFLLRLRHRLLHWKPLSNDSERFLDREVASLPKL